MGRNVFMICTVRTSLLQGHKIDDVISKSNAAYSIEALYDPKSDEPILDFIQNIFRFDEKGIPPDREKVYKLLRDVPQMPETELEQVSFDGCRFPTAEMQTIIRWLAENRKNKNVSRLRIVLLPSKTPVSELNAHAACVCINRLSRIFPDTEIICSRQPDTIIPLEIDVNERDKFLLSISGLFNEFDRQIKSAARSHEEAVICATGSFKSVSGFAMMYAQINSIPCLYTFETSPKVFEVMSVPLGYAYASMDEEINMLKAIAKNSSINTSAFPQWVRDSKELAESLLESYYKAREKPYGTGEYLFNKLRKCKDGDKWADYLQSLLTHNWSHLWAGDQIPETVEHSRRHSKRLMEFAANLFRAAPNLLEKLGFDYNHPELLAILIAAIYLHDIGHTALSYPMLDKLDKNKINDVFPLGLFPSSVREVHHILTGRLLRMDSARERYFTSNNINFNNNEMISILMTCVPLIAEHHRGYTKLKGKNAERKAEDPVRLVGELLFGHDEFEETLRPLEQRYIKIRENCRVEPEHLLNLTAIMRIIDGCDVQADRVIGADYLEYRNSRTDDEARLLKNQLESLKNYLSSSVKDAVDELDELKAYSKNKYSKAYAEIFKALHALKDKYGSWNVIRQKALPEFMALSLASRVAFKGEQKFHFAKHQNVSFVLPALKEPNIIEVQVFPNDSLNLNINNEVDCVCKDIEGEYEKVKDILGDIIKFIAKRAS